MSESEPEPAPESVPVPAAVPAAVPATAPAPRPRAKFDSREHSSDPVDTRVLAVLEAERRPLTSAEVAEKTGLSAPTVQRALGKLVDERRARRAGAGRFTLAAPKGRRKRAKPEGTVPGPKRGPAGKFTPRKTAVRRRPAGRQR